MRATALALPGVLLIEHRLFDDARGAFFESWNERDFAAAGIAARFVQENVSRSRAYVLRGLHYQIRQTQGKLVRVLAGSIFDAVVDLRRSSPTFGQSCTVQLDATAARSLWVPPGFAHGFLVLSERAEFLYKTTDYWYPEHERTLLWNDPAIGIEWPVNGAPLVAPKDAKGTAFAEAAVYP